MPVAMRVLVDLGNARLKWARLEGETLHPGAPVHLVRGWEKKLAPAWAGLPPPEAVVASNVAGEDNAWILGRLCARLWHLEPEFVRVQTPFQGLETAYRHPQRLGSDRWLALLAAWRLGLAPCLVVDAGSALTLDLLEAGGHHPGGLILPGPRRMRTCLLEGTHIPDPGPGSAAEFVARDTAGGIRNGIQAAVLGAIDRARRHLPGEARLVLTGGDAGDLIRGLGPAEVRPYLVLEGLAAFSGRNL